MDLWYLATVGLAVELGSGSMDLLTDRQYGLEVGAHLLCYTCQSVDTNGAKA